MVEIDHTEEWMRSIRFNITDNAVIGMGAVAAAESKYQRRLRSEHLGDEGLKQKASLNKNKTVRPL